MPKRNPIAEILEAFEDFVSNGARLPVLPDGKVNVTGLCKILGLRATDAQYFHKSEEVKGAVNALCEDQGIHKIGHRAQSEEDARTGQRVARIQKQATQNARAATEQAAGSEALLLELSEARRKIEDLKLERDSLAERLAILESGGIPPRL